MSEKTSFINPGLKDQWKRLNLDVEYRHLQYTSRSASLLIELCQEYKDTKKVSQPPEIETDVVKRYQYVVAAERLAFFREFYDRIIRTLQKAARDIEEDAYEGNEPAMEELMFIPVEVINNTGAKMLADIRQQPPEETAVSELEDLALEIGSRFREDLPINFQDLQRSILPVVRAVEPVRVLRSGDQT